LSGGSCDGSVLWPGNGVAADGVAGAAFVP